MTISVLARLDAAERFARSRVVNALRDRLNQPVTAYALRLTSWVFQGDTSLPQAAPTDAVRKLVRAAVDRGLQEVCGDANSSQIPEGVRLRRSTLWRDAQ